MSDNPVEEQDPGNSAPDSSKPPPAIHVTVSGGLIIVRFGRSLLRSPGSLVEHLNFSWLYVDLDARHDTVELNSVAKNLPRWVYLERLAQQAIPFLSRMPYSPIELKEAS